MGRGGRQTGSGGNQLRTGMASSVGIPEDEADYRQRYGSEAYLQRLRVVAERNSQAYEKCDNDDERIVVEHMINGSVFDRDQSFFSEPELLYQDFRGRLDRDSVQNALRSLQEKNVVNQVDLRPKIDLTVFVLNEDS